MPRYFNYFPKTLYNYNESSVDAVTNLTSKVKFDDNIVDNTVAYYQYDIQDGETPETIAGNIYDDPEKHWAILMINDIINPQNDWLMNQSSLNSYIDKKYEENANTSNNETGLVWARTNIHSYYKIETKTNNNANVKTITKIQIDQNTYSNLSTSITTYELSGGENITLKTEKEQKTYYQYEVEENEKKRTIKLLKREVVDLLDMELKRVFSS